MSTVNDARFRPGPRNTTPDDATHHSRSTGTRRSRNQGTEGQVHQSPGFFRSYWGNWSDTGCRSSGPRGSCGSPGCAPIGPEYRFASGFTAGCLGGRQLAHPPLAGPPTKAGTSSPSSCMLAISISDSVGEAVGQPILFRCSLSDRRPVRHPAPVALAGVDPVDVLAPGPEATTPDHGRLTVGRLTLATRLGSVTIRKHRPGRSVKASA